jgi:NTP pyrophosphatase (non-canonical NTP hydrolase)
MHELIQAVQKWSVDRNIPSEATPMAQGLKTLEEVQELLVALESGDRDEVEDAIGDIIVTLIIQCQLKNLDLQACLLRAYQTISSRTGVMVNGQFIKDT